MLFGLRFKISNTDFSGFTRIFIFAFSESYREVRLFCFYINMFIVKSLNI